MTRVDQFVAAMISTWAMPKRTPTYEDYKIQSVFKPGVIEPVSAEEYDRLIKRAIENEKDVLRIVVERAIVLDQLIADHERTQLISVDETAPEMPEVQQVGLSHLAKV
jgi:hypothetical protein